jgi:alpha-tubulin suppressor-like RCC1 family protein
MKIGGLAVGELRREDLRTLANMRGRGVLQRWRSAIPVLQACGKEVEAQQQQRRWLASDASRETTTLEVGTWGRGEAGQLGLGRESTERSPSLLEFLPHAFRLAPMPGALRPTNPDSSPQSAEQVGIACGLFHSCLWKNGELWLWGKGDGGRLGTGSEASLYSPRLNPFLSHVHSVALGGLHSAALTESGDVLTL